MKTGMYPINILPEGHEGLEDGYRASFHTSYGFNLHNTFTYLLDGICLLHIKLHFKVGI